MKKCKYCGKLFKPRSPEQVFCDRVTCRNERTAEYEKTYPYKKGPRVSPADLAKMNLKQKIDLIQEKLGYIETVEEHLNELIRFGTGIEAEIQIAYLNELINEVKQDVGLIAGHFILQTWPKLQKLIGFAPTPLGLPSPVLPFLKR